MQPVFRVDAYGEPAVPFPTLAEARRQGPRGPESYIATSPEGVHLADAFPCAGPGTILVWRLTLAGKDVRDREGWTAGAPPLSEEEYETIIAIALAEDLERAS